MKLVNSFSSPESLDESEDKIQLVIAQLLEKYTPNFSDWERTQTLNLFLMGVVFDDLHDVQVEMNEYTISIFQPNGVVVGGLSFYGEPGQLGYHILDTMRPDGDSEEFEYYLNMYRMWGKIAGAAITLRNVIPSEFWRENPAEYSAQSDDWIMYQLWRLYPQYRDTRFKGFPDYIKQGLRERP